VGYAVDVNTSVESDRTMGTRLPLRDLKLAPGQAVSKDLDVEVHPYKQGGFDYAVEGGAVAARVDVTRMQEGLDLRLRTVATFHGPCSRCLEPATTGIEVDLHEIHDPSAGDPEMLSDFVDGDENLDLTAWAQDATGVQFPVRVLCTLDCQGLCPQCGINRNEASCACAAPQGDSRWDALKDLKFD
jgi:uncharacterized protein